jgi:hypothetical protein
MKPIGPLMREHRLIEKMLRFFEEDVIGNGKHEELHKQLEAFNAKYLK